MASLKNIHTTKISTFVVFCKIFSIHFHENILMTKFLFSQIFFLTATKSEGCKRLGLHQVGYFILTYSGYLCKGNALNKFLHARLPRIWDLCSSHQESKCNVLATYDLPVACGCTCPVCSYAQ